MDRIVNETEEEREWHAAWAVWLTRDILAKQQGRRDEEAEERCRQLLQSNRDGRYAFRLQVQCTSYADGRKTWELWRQPA